MAAQSLGEYSAQGGGVSGSFQRLYDSFRLWIGDVTPATWVVIGAALVALWVFMGRRTRS